MHARAKGRGSQIIKRTSHITVVVGTAEEITMGHKVHPTGIRLGISKDWNSKWFANKRDYAQYLAADLKVRELLHKKLAQAGMSKIQIERPAKTARITIHTARPGVVIGKKGEDIEKLRKEVTRR